MNKLFHPLLVMIAKATSTELQQYIDYLKAENQILRSKLPRRVDVTPAEREKLVKVGNQPEYLPQETGNKDSDNRLSTRGWKESDRVGRSAACVGKTIL
jgi:hypothetical protein